MPEIISLGEILIDFTEEKSSEQGNPLFESNPGGAPCNVLAMLKKLNHEVAFIGKVGKDFFGSFLIQRLNDLGMDTSQMVKDAKIPTTLAFVHNEVNGERSFQFYRNPGADILLAPEDIQEEKFQEIKLFHFGTLSMTSPSSKKATLKGITLAKQNHSLVSFDPNLRKNLWDSLQQAKEAFYFGFQESDIVKISDDEIHWLFKTEDLVTAGKKLQQDYQIPLLFITAGVKGSYAFYQNEWVFVPGIPNEKTKDTTGAGDTFFGSVLHFILEIGIENITIKDLKEMLLFANGAASLITTKKGALSVMPSKSEVLKYLEEKEVRE